MTVETFGETTYFFRLGEGRCRPPHRLHRDPRGAESCGNGDDCEVDEAGKSTCGEYACPRCGSDRVQVGGARYLCDSCGKRWEP